MEKEPIKVLAALIIASSCGLIPASELLGSATHGSNIREDAQSYLSPAALVVTADGTTLFIACETANQVAVFDTVSNRIRQRIQVQNSPLGVVLSKDEERLFVACAAPSSRVCVVDVASGRIIEEIPTGHTSMAPVMSRDARTLYVCNRFSNDISVIDLDSLTELRRIAVSREPVAAAITPDGRFLLVANHVYDRRLDGPGIAARVSVIDTAAESVVKQIMLPRGSGLLRGIAVSPDGRFAAVTHLLARYYLETTEVDFGRINGNSLSLLDLNRLAYHRSVMLDYAGRGAANPWAVAFTPDGKTIVVTHAGTHEVSLVDAPALLQKPVRSRTRIALPGKGPRSLAIAGSRLFVANYFSDDLCSVDLDKPNLEPTSVRLGPAREPSLTRKGEMFFNDATICFQGWQSCASCHDTDARMDGMNWDLLNDGTGNPKNAKSLVWAHRTPPVMSLGVRADAETAVRAGIRHILFTSQPEEVPVAIDAFLKTLNPIPSPHLENGKMSVAAERGQEVFLSDEAGCARCHEPPLFTDQKLHNVDTLGSRDNPDDRFDTPTLVELWRTAPYLHNGSVATVKELITTANARDLHGKTSNLSEQQIEDLAEYLLSQ